MTPAHAPDDDLRWRAFRYVAGELDDDARRAFEARLADDPDACAAVAASVELLGACLKLGPPTALRRRPVRRWVASALALAAAAAIVLALLPGVGDRSTGPGGGDPGETIALERAWSRLQRSMPTGDEIEQDLDDWESGQLAGALDDDNEGEGPPGWLLAAVELADSEPKPLEN